MKFGSICDGIGAATEAWEPLGWEPNFVAEIEAFACHVLAERHGATAPENPIDPAQFDDPKERRIWENNNKQVARLAKARIGHNSRVRNVGDFTAMDPAQFYDTEVLIGGPPCQAFSIAGMRGSLGDHRGNLTLSYVELVHDLAANGSLRWSVYENVPGILSTKDNAFGCFLGALVGHDAPIPPPDRRGRWTDAGVVVGPRARAAWRILDTQYFGLPQRRRRVFVVAGFGEGTDPVSVLFERQGVRRNPQPGGEARQEVSGTITASLGSRSAEAIERGTLVAAFGGKNQSGEINVATALNAHPNAKGRLDFGTETFIVEGEPEGFPQLAHTLRAEGFDASEDGTGRGTPIIPFDTTQLTNPNNRSNPQPGDPCHGLAANQHPPAVAFTCKDSGQDAGDPAPTLRAMGHGASHADGGGQVAIAINFENSLAPHGSLEGGEISPALTGSEEKDHTAIVYADDVSGPIISTHGDGGMRTTDVESSSLVAIRTTHTGPNGDPIQADVAHTLDTCDTPQAVAFSLRGREDGAQAEAESGDVAPTLRTGSGGATRGGFVAGLMETAKWVVRRLTPTECERLQGFPDGFTQIPWNGKAAEDCPDGGRYKCLGNSMSVPVITWIGLQIEAADKARSSDQTQLGQPREDHKQSAQESGGL